LSYHVHTTDANRDYLDNLPLSDDAKGRVRDFVRYGIADVTDAVRNDPANRPYPGDPFFERRLLLLDLAGDGLVHGLRFVVSDEHAAVGVLVIV
jgi:hypothetical protein